MGIQAVPAALTMKRAVAGSELLSILLRKGPQAKAIRAQQEVVVEAMELRGRIIIRKYLCLAALTLISSTILIRGRRHFQLQQVRLLQR